MELRDLLKRLKDMAGSEMHVVAGLPPAVRVNRELTAMRELGRPTPEDVHNMVYSILAKEEIERFENDERWRYDLEFGRGIPDLGRFRFVVYKQRGTIAFTVRALSDTIPPLDSLGLPVGVLDFARSIRGLVLITGPSGSGRSTTLASLIDRINHERTVRIMTIENPVEYTIPSDRAFVTQREVGDGSDTLSIENALRYAGRQGVDVIMIGNLNSYETMRLALELAEMGTLILGSMFTFNAGQTLSRFVECFPPEQQAQAVSQLSTNLIGILSQVLLPRADRRGRVLACELMKVNALIQSEIRQQRFEAIYSIMQTTPMEGMQTLDQSLVELARQNYIDYATARPYIREESAHRMIYQLTGAGRLGVPMPPPSVRPTAAPEFGVPSRGPSDSQIRRRLGTAVIPPWEKQP